MNTKLLSVVVLAAVWLFSGCTEKAQATQSAQDDAAAKARADALKKEMQTAPKVFSNFDAFKKNEPPPPTKATPALEKKQ